jgi:hypothetical protein
MFAIMGFSAIGFQRLDVETDFSKNFRESSPIVRSLTFFEDKMGGAGTWEVNFPAPKKLDSQYLKHVEELARLLREEFVRNGEGEITKVVAITDALKEIPPPVVRLVLKQKMTIDERLEMMAKFQPEFTQSLYHPDQGRMRIVLRSREQQQSAVKLLLITRVESVVAKWWAENDDLSREFPNAKPKATGLYVLLAFLIDNLLKDQLVSFGLAALGITSMMMIAFRSSLIGIASLIPNLFPILLVIGGMGWLGVPINIATAMIASVSMGLTVDSSIHYISGYRRARLAGLSVDEALQQTQGQVGRALMFANLALIVGFSVLTLSHFIPLVYFGVLVSVAMAGGLVGNLVLLPLLLGWIDRNQQVTEVSSSPDEIKNEQTD